jgi:hypothetical protein
MYRRRPRLCPKYVFFSFFVSSLHRHLACAGGGRGGVPNTPGVYAVVNLRVDWARLVLSPSRSAHELADWCAVVNLRVDWARLVLSPSRSAHELADLCVVVNLRVDWARLVLSPRRSAHELTNWCAVVNLLLVLRESAFSQFCLYRRRSRRCPKYTLFYSL